MSSPKIIIIEGVVGPTLYAKEKDGYIPVGDKWLKKWIPQFPNLTISEKEKQLNKWLSKEADVVCHVKPKKFLPNARKKGNLQESLRLGAQALLNSTAVFEMPAPGYTIMADILSSLHLTALREVEPSFHPVINISASRPEIKDILVTLIRAVVTKKKWHGEHHKIEREAVLDYGGEVFSGLSHQIQDFSCIKVRCKSHKVKAAYPYTDTILLISEANKSQVKELTSYIENAAVILLNSSTGDLTTTKLPLSSVSAYDPAVLARIEAESSKISALLRWWWGDSLEDEGVWARGIVQKARTSFGKPDSRYIRVELDPKKLRDAIRYRVLLSFFDELEKAGFLTAEELEPYRLGAKGVFDPAPPEPVVVRHADDAEVFLEIMRKLVQNSLEHIVPEGKRFVKSEKPLGAWRTISGTRYLVLLENDWSQVYSKTARAHKNIDCSFFQVEGWERNLQKVLGERGLVKQPSCGYRYRYDLLGTGKRDSTYVLAIPANLLLD